MNLFAFILASAASVSLLAQQSWQTPAWGVSLFLLGVFVKYILEALKRQTDKREAAEAHARALEDNLILIEVRAMSEKLNEINRRLERGDKRFEILEGRVGAIEKDVHEIREAQKEHKAA